MECMIVNTASGSGLVVREGPARNAAHSPTLALLPIGMQKTYTAKASNLAITTSARQIVKVMCSRSSR
jgi:hypothetical protein